MRAGKWLMRALNRAQKELGAYEGKTAATVCVRCVSGVCVVYLRGRTARAGAAVASIATCLTV